MDILKLILLVLLLVTAIQKHRAMKDRIKWLKEMDVKIEILKTNLNKYDPPN